MLKAVLFGISILSYFVFDTLRLTRTQYLVFFGLLFVSFMYLRKKLKYKLNSVKTAVFSRYLVLTLIMSLVFRLFFSDFDKAYYPTSILKNLSIGTFSFIVIASITEELIFRGFLQTFIATINEKVSVILPSILFSWSHFHAFQSLNLPYTMWASLYVFFVSILFSYSLYKTKNYSIPFILHPTYNILTSIQLILEITNPTGEIVFWIISLLSLFYFAKDIKAESH